MPEKYKKYLYLKWFWEIWKYNSLQLKVNKILHLEQIPTFFISWNRLWPIFHFQRWFFFQFLERYFIWISLYESSILEASPEQVLLTLLFIHSLCLKMFRFWHSLAFFSWIHPINCKKDRGNLSTRSIEKKNHLKPPINHPNKGNFRNWSPYSLGRLS